MQPFNPHKLREYFGDIDIYLFDQLLKGRIRPGMRILDAGCGNGRNLVYFLRAGFEVFAVDQSAKAVDQVKMMAAELAPGLNLKNIRLEQLDDLSFEDERFDVVISNAVLHFVENDHQFYSRLKEMWRVLQIGGFLFCRLASSIGIEDRIKPIGKGRFLLPDGSQRFLVDEKMLKDLTVKLNGKRLEPIKTTNVQNLRSMTTWCLLKL